MKFKMFFFRILIGDLIRAEIIFEHSVMSATGVVGTHRVFLDITF